MQLRCILVGNRAGTTETTEDSTMPKAATPTFEVDQIIKFKGYDPAPADGAIFKPGQLLKITKINAEDQGMEAFPVGDGNEIETDATGDSVFPNEVTVLVEPPATKTGNASMP